MPERSKDGKYWIARFKSTTHGNWRGPCGVYKCCYCNRSNVKKKYNARDQLNCVCGKDMWVQAKQHEDRKKLQYQTHTLIYQLHKSISNGTASKMCRLLEKVCAD